MSTTKNRETTLTTQKTPTEIKNLLLQNTHILAGDLADSLAHYDAILSRPRPKTKHQKEQMQKELQAPILSAMHALEVESHIALMETFPEKYRGMVKELTDQTIKEYGCTTHVEKMVAETLAGSFVRYIDSSRRYNKFIPGTGTTGVQNQLLGVMSKQTDRAYRQFLSAVSMLKQLKQPQLEINIQTKNAFVAQNQQFNANAPQP